MRAELENELKAKHHQISSLKKELQEKQDKLNALREEISEQEKPKKLKEKGKQKLIMRVTNEHTISSIMQVSYYLVVSSVRNRNSMPSVHLPCLLIAFTPQLPDTSWSSAVVFHLSSVL